MILVTGANGMLGSAVCELAPDARPCTRDGWDLRHDIPSGLLDGVTRVIHAAAMTHVDGCSEDAVTAFTVNALAVGRLAEACQARRIHMVHVGSDYGRGHGAYGESKAAGEVLARHYGATVVRVQALYRLDMPCFLTEAVRCMREGRTMKVVRDQWMLPTACHDAARYLLRDDLPPLSDFTPYHACGVNRVRTVHVLGRLLGLSPNVQEVTRRDVFRSPRPENSWVAQPARRVGVFDALETECKRSGLL